MGAGSDLLPPAQEAGFSFKKENHGLKFSRPVVGRGRGRVAPGGQLAAPRLEKPEAAPLPPHLAEQKAGLWITGRSLRACSGSGAVICASGSLSWRGGPASVAGFGVSPGLKHRLEGSRPHPLPAPQPAATHPWVFHQGPDPGLPSGVLGRLQALSPSAPGGVSRPKTELQPTFADPHAPLDHT